MFSPFNTVDYNQYILSHCSIGKPSQGKARKGANVVLFTVCKQKCISKFKKHEKHLRCLRGSNASERERVRESKKFNGWELGELCWRCSHLRSLYMSSRDNFAEKQKKCGSWSGPDSQMLTSDWSSTLFPGC